MLVFVFLTSSFVFQVRHRTHGGSDYLTLTTAPVLLGWWWTWISSKDRLAGRVSEHCTYEHGERPLIRIDLDVQPASPSVLAILIMMHLPSRLWWIARQISWLAFEILQALLRHYRISFGRSLGSNKYYWYGENYSTWCFISMYLYHGPFSLVWPNLLLPLFWRELWIRRQRIRERTFEPKSGLTQITWPKSRIDQVQLEGFRLTSKVSGWSTAIVYTVNNSLFALSEELANLRRTTEVLGTMPDRTRSKRAGCAVMRFMWRLLVLKLMHLCLYNSKFCCSTSLLCQGFPIFVRRRLAFL